MFLISNLKKVKPDTYKKYALFICIIMLISFILSYYELDKDDTVLNGTFGLYIIFIIYKTIRNQ